MGAAILKPQKSNPQEFPKLLEETQFFALWSMNDVKELFKRLRLQVYGYALVEAQFESIMTFKEGLSDQICMETLFEILDNDHDGRIDGLELLGGLALCCQATFEDKARFCFELYDFNLTSTLSRKEMIMMMMVSICGINILTGGGEELEPDIETIELLSDDAFLCADRDNSGQISYEDFIYWARSNRDLMAAMESLNKVANDAKLDVESDDSAPETDDGNLTDCEPTLEHGADNKIYRKDQMEISSQSIAAAIAAKLSESKSSLNPKSGPIPPPLGGDEAVSAVQWKGQIAEPTNYKASRHDKDGPETNLELCWAFGYRTQGGSRNNLCYVGAETDPETQRVAYPTATLGVIYDMKSKEQSFYLGHSEEITCLALHRKGVIIATGDISSNIHIWNSVTMSCQCVIKGIISHGVQRLVFSPSGDRLASVGLDPDHTIAVYDCTTGEIISSAKGLVSPNNVNDIAYSANGTEIVIVGKSQIKYYNGANTSKRALDSYPGKIGKAGKKQMFFCCVYFNDEVIVGCASGELYRFKYGQCVQIVQAHGIKEPVFSLGYNSKEGVLVSGGKDSMVKTWDSTLKEVGVSLDMSEDLDGDGQPDSGSLDGAVISVHMLHNRVLIGTRGGDIFEAHLPVRGRANDSYSLLRIGWSHCKGEFWGLAVHPLRDEFATCGSDKTLRIWSLRSKEQSNVRSLPSTALTIAYSPKGEIIAVGMIDGSIGLLEAESPSLKAYSSWKNCNQAISDLKFSPDGKLLAAGSDDGNIYIYVCNDDKKTFRRQAVCRGHDGAVTHIDFSASSQFIQSNCSDLSLLFWDIQGNQVKTVSSLRDATWASLTCVLGWPVQGIYNEGGSFDDVNACSAVPDVGDIVTGNTDHCVKLYRYPSLYPGSLHQSYKGHASSVSNVRFSYNRRHVISLGRDDCCILLWAHTMEQAESSGDEANTTSTSTSIGIIDTRKEIGDVGPRSLLQEAVNSNQPVEVIAQIARLEGPHRDLGSHSARTVQPWKGVISEPSTWTPAVGGTDVDLELQWIHGYRAHDCRNNVRYSAAGSIVYTAAAVGIVYSKSAGKQKFFLGAHSDDIIGIAAHPSGQLYATGETGRQPSIIVWSSQDMRSVARMELSHQFGVPLLGFNSRGDLLASVGLDDNHTLVIHDWTKSITVLRTPTDKRTVLCMCYLADSVTDLKSSIPAPTALATNYEYTSASNNIIVTAGYKHVKFWWSQGQNVSSQRGIFGKEERGIIMSVASGTPGVCLTGSVNGVLLLWENFKVTSNVKTHYGVYSHEVGYYPHASAIQAIWSIVGTVEELYDGSAVDEYQSTLSTSARYITGDKDGLVAIWRVMRNKHNELRLRIVSLLDVSLLLPTPVSPSVRSVTEREGTLLIGTFGSEIFEVIDDNIPALEVAFAALQRKNTTLPLPPTPDALTVANIRAVPVPSSYSASTTASTSTTQTGGPRGPSSITGATSMTGGTGLTAGKKIDNTAGFLRSVQALRLVSGHYQGELWGLAMHPSLPVYLTCGDDGLICCWSLVQHKLLSYTKLPEKLRAIDVIPTDGSEVAVALNSGAVWVIQTKLLLNPKKILHVEMDLTLSSFELVLTKEVLDIARTYSRASISSSTSGQVTAVSNSTIPFAASIGQLPATQTVTPAVATSLPATTPDVSAIALAPTPTAAAVIATPTAVQQPKNDAANVQKKNKKPDVRILATGATQWAQELKYSFEGSVLAVGSHDTNIYIYNVKDEYELQKTDTTGQEGKKSKNGHTDFITHIDFGIILTPKLNKIMTYDEVTRKIITSELQLEEKNERKGPTGCLESGSKIPPGISTGIASGFTSLTVDKNEKMKKSKWVVTSTRDLSGADICIQSTCGAGGLLYWHLDGSRIGSPEIVKDAWWSSWSLPVGWPVQGIWPPGVDSSEYSINAVARSHSWNIVPVLATADDYGRIKVYNYPCESPGAPDKCYKGHSKHVTNIKFSNDDSFCVTTGGSDKCVFVWGTDIIEERREREALSRGPPITVTSTIETESFLPYKQALTSGGDEIMAVKPWAGAIRAPTNFAESPDLGELPDASLELKFVYGYRGWDCRNNVSYADNCQEVVYHVAGVGIVFDSEKQTQILNTEHDDDILCLAVHPEGHTVATGETGPHPKIVLWDANTGVTLSVIKYHKKGVSNIVFGASGTLLISVGMDDDRTIAVHNTRTSALVGTGKAGRGVDVYALSVGGEDRFVTGGKNYIKFWDLPSATSAGGELSSKGGIYGKNVKARSVISTAFLGSDTVTGMDDGTLVLWKDRNSTKSIQAHTGPVTAMCAVESSLGGATSGGVASGGSGESNSPRIITGGKDGFVHVFNIQLTKEWTLDLNSSSPVSAMPQIQALSTKEGRILIGTKGSEIYEVNQFNPSEIFRYVQGHFGPRGEVWGLAVHPNANKFVTAGDDETVRLWDGKAMQQVGITSIGAKVRSLAYSNDGSHIAAATFDGRLIVLSGDLERKIAEVSVAKSWIQTMAYSPDGLTLAVGSHDDMVYLLSTKSYNCRATCKGHHSYITALDFSSDGTKLQTTSGDYELLYWDANDGRQILSATEMRDISWASTTCTLGWGVQGIWPPGADGTDVNSVDRSPDNTIIATGDDFRRVKIFKYPCPKEKSKFKEYKGHSEFVVNVKFSKDGKWLYTVGGLDKAVFQFEVKAGVSSGSGSGSAATSSSASSIQKATVQAPVPVKVASKGKRSRWTGIPN